MTILKTGVYVFIEYLYEEKKKKKNNYIEMIDAFFWM